MINKIDLPNAEPERVIKELEDAIGFLGMKWFCQCQNWARHRGYRCDSQVPAPNDLSPFALILTRILTLSER